MSVFERRERFCDRRARSAGTVELRGTRLKRYDITADGGPVDERSYAKAEEMAGRMLPTEAVSRHRPGVGFIIRHTGAGMEYLVLCTWDNQNELITRVLVRRRETGAGEWRDGAGTHSFCVWDVEVMWREREVFVRRVMTPDAPDIEGYAAEFVA